MTRPIQIWQIAVSLLIATLTDAVAADPQARCDAALLRAMGAAVADLVRCGGNTTPVRGGASCRAIAEEAFMEAAAKAGRSACTSTRPPAEQWTRASEVAAELAAALEIAENDRSKCTAKRVVALSEGVEHRIAVHGKVRKEPAPERFGRALLSSAAAIERLHSAAERARDCPRELRLQSLGAEIDAAVQALLESVYACERVAPETLSRLATGKWAALFEHASSLGYSTVSAGVLCPGAAAIETGQAPLIAEARLVSASGEELSAVGYPGAGVTTLVREGDGSVAVFHWLGGLRVTKTTPPIEEVDSAGLPVVDDARQRSAAPGLFDACKEAHNVANRCWVTHCSSNLQYASACVQLLQCLGNSPKPGWILINALGCAAAVQTVSGIPCPKPGQLLPCTLPGEDPECPVSGQCNILDVCRPDKNPGSDQDECKPDKPILGVQAPYCRDDGRLQKARCLKGACVMAKPVTCAEGCCGEDGEAHCWSGPGSCGPICGNGTVEEGEACDDGNTAGGDSCPPDCKLSRVFWFTSGGVRAGRDTRPRVEVNNPWSANFTINASQFFQEGDIYGGDAPCPTRDANASVRILGSATGGTTSGTFTAHIEAEANRKDCRCGGMYGGGNSSVVLCGGVSPDVPSYTIDVVRNDWRLVGSGSGYCGPYAPGGIAGKHPFQQDDLISTSFIPPADVSSDPAQARVHVENYPGFYSFCFGLYGDVGWGGSTFAEGIVTGDIEVRITIPPATP